MTRSAILIVAAMAIAAPSAATAGDPSQNQTAQNADPSQKVVCKFIDTTGSRLSRNRDCRTRAQWERESQQTGEDVERQRARATGDPLDTTGRVAGPH